MYKQQKPLNLSSGILALVLTAVVLLLAASANAQEPAPMKIEAVVAPNEVRPATIVDPINSQMPMPDRATSSTERPLPPEARARIQEAPLRDQNMGTTRADMAAANDARPATLEERRQEWQTRIAERRTELEQKRAALASSTAARRAALSETAQERVKDLSNRLATKLSEVILKIQNLSDRLRNRAEELAERGVDISAVIPKLDQVDALLRSAEAALDGIDTNIEYTVTSDEPRSDWEDTKAQLRTVREMIIEARSLLREALTALKDAVQEASIGQGVSEAVSQDDATSENDQ